MKLWIIHMDDFLNTQPLFPAIHFKFESELYQGILATIPSFLCSKLYFTLDFLQISNKSFVFLGYKFL